MELKEVFEPIIHFLQNFQRKQKDAVSKDKAKERLQLVLMQDRASVSPDFFDMMKKEIIEVIKKYIEIDEEQLEVQLTRGFENGDDTGPALYANIPIKNIKPVAKKVEEKEPEVIVKGDEKTPEELTNNIIEDIKVVAENTTNGSKKKHGSKNKKGNIQKTSIDSKEEVATTNNESASTTNNENIDKIETEEIVEEVSESVECEADQAVDNIETIEEVESIDEANVDKIEEVENEANVDLAETEEVVEENKEVTRSFKDKLNNVREGAIETFSKVKTSAKDGFEKIKSKVKAKN